MEEKGNLKEKKFKKSLKQAKTQKKNGKKNFFKEKKEAKKRIKKWKKKTKGLVCRQYLHLVDIDFLSTTCQIHTHLLTPLHYPLPTHGSHFYTLTTFDVIEFFFLYGPPTLKTLCDLTSFCYCKASFPSHTPQKKKTQETKNQENIYIDGNRKK